MGLDPGVAQALIRGLRRSRGAARGACEQTAPTAPLQRCSQRAQDLKKLVTIREESRDLFQFVFPGTALQPNTPVSPGGGGRNEDGCGPPGPPHHGGEGSAPRQRGSRCPAPVPRPPGRASLLGPQAGAGSRRRGRWLRTAACGESPEKMEAGAIAALSACMAAAGRPRGGPSFLLRRERVSFPPPVWASPGLGSHTPPEPPRAPDTAWPRTRHSASGRPRSLSRTFPARGLCQPGMAGGGRPLLPSCSGHGPPGRRGS